MPNLLREVTSFGAWQKTRQKKTAEECRIVQEIAGHRYEKTPENAAENGVLPTYTHIPIELRGHSQSQMLSQSISEKLPSDKRHDRAVREWPQRLETVVLGLRTAVACRAVGG
jgi:hypothetical protein